MTLYDCLLLIIAVWGMVGTSIFVAAFAVVAWVIWQDYKDDQ
jgi:hypothetical protein